MATEKEIDDLLMEIRLLEFHGDRKEEFMEKLKEILSKIVLLMKKK
ncbi:hypothetical protein LCGC14_1875860 [marine sediment metagenome]|uniref:Uncharacterized protein n=1 Tax=marine sediment metagenome TaxID=412755 RepID=A0A0F9G3N5_9ZZZZ